MKEPFWWNNNGQWIPIYSLEKFIYFCNLDPQKALQCLQDMWIEYWFYQNGESFLGQKVESIRTDGDVAVNDKVPRLIEELSPFGHSKKFFKLLNIDKAIEITLKEYETLRAEILQNQSELSQLILLGLAAIFTIASLGLAPLADFLTVENTIIEMPLQLEKISDIFKQKQAFISIDNVNYKIDNEHEKQQLTVIETPPIKLREVLEKIDSNTNKKTIEETLVEIKEIINQEYIDNGLEPNKFDIETAEVLIRGKSKNPKYFLKITRAIDGETIEKQGIVPSIVILNWLIPGLSLYLIYRSLFSIQKNKMIGIYIYYRVEKRLIELSKDKAEYLWYITPDTMRKSYLTNMGWENYIRGDPNYLEPLDVTLILVIFSVISLASFLGGSILFLWDFEEPKFQFHNLPNILLNIFSEQKDVILGLVVLLIIPLIIWVVFFLFCWVKRSYIKNLDQPKKLNKINPYWHLLTIQIPIVFEIIREKCTFWGFRIFKRYPKKYIDLRLEKKRKQLEKIIENLIKQLQSLRTNNNLTQNKLNYFIKQLQSMKKKLQKVSSKKIDNLDFFPNKLNFMLDTMYFMLPRIFDFVLINTEIYQKSKFQNSKKLKKFKKFQKIEKSINKLSRKIIILQHINRWSNPKFRFESIFEDIVDDMWK